MSAWQSAYKGLLPTDYLNQISIDTRISNWQDWINISNPNTTFVIEDKENLVGFCIFGPTLAIEANDPQTSSSHGEILSLNIHPDHWRCGLGKQLCQAVISESLQRRWKNLSLWTLKTNEPAKQFYHTLGFSPDRVYRIEKLSENNFVEEAHYNMVLPSV